MSRLPLALIWLLAVVAGALPTTRPAAEWRAETGIVAADPGAIPPLFKPARIERLQAAAPVRPSPWRHSSPHADLVIGSGLSDLVPTGRVERSSRRLPLTAPVSRIGVPRFPTGPPAA